jgi:tetratricopeptide (TPR) repeat protein
MRSNQELLSQALSYYTNLGNIDGQARSLLAKGQNYLYDLNTRYSALKSAEDKFRQLKNPALLIDTLNYRAYFYIQLHLGANALPILEEAKDILSSLNSPARTHYTNFLFGLAHLDLGIDRGNGAKPKELKLSLSYFDTLYEQAPPPEICQQRHAANAQLLSAWALSELGSYNEAVPLIESSLTCYDRFKAPVSYRFAQNSLMEIYAHQENWQALLDLSDLSDQDTLNLQYRARAFYELGDTNKAIAQMEKIASLFPNKWDEAMQHRLNHYKSNQQLTKVASITLGKEPSSHLVFCEDLWNLNESNEFKKTLLTKHEISIETDK